jgi:cytochrome c oxidase subunit 2
VFARPLLFTAKRVILVAVAAVATAACAGNAPVQLAKHALTGRQLYVADGCEDCHSLDGTPSTGPTWRGLYGSRVELASGRFVTANAAYLVRHIVAPNAMTVHGYPGSVMAQAIAGDQLARRPAEVRKLVAFIESLRRVRASGD